MIHLGDEVLKLGIGIGYGVCEIDRLVFLFEVIFELQLKCFLIESVSAYPFCPNHVIAVILSPLTVYFDVGSHPVGIEVLSFTEIADI